MRPDEPDSGHVLVVDDDPLLRSMAARTLQHAGFRVSVAESGPEALALLADRPFSLVLLDVVMPGLDGYEVCVRLRALPQGVSLPVLMLTGLNEVESIERAFDAGATDFIAKPIHWTLLAQRVRHALRAAAAAASAVRSRAQLERAQQLARMGSWELSADGRSLRCSAALGELLAGSAAELAGMTPRDFLARVHEGDRPQVQLARHQVSTGGAPYRLAYRILRFDDTECSVLEQAQALRDRSGRLLAVEGITQDITDRVQAEQRITELSHYDSTTGLPNRLLFNDLAMPALERAARLGSAAAMLHVDIDRFKSVNDALGRPVGDRVLRLLADRLQASVRASDVSSAGVGAEACVARVGANAFTLLLLEVGSERHAAQVAERLMAAVALPLQVDEHELMLSASVGIAMYPRDAHESRALARCAEQAVYEAKAAGRDQHRFFDAATHQAAGERLRLETELRRGIAQGQLRLHYQPKFDATSGQIIGAEALVRWQHPQRGLVPPDQFIALAEEVGLIGPLTDWVLETACADLRRRTERGLPALPVSVNLASSSFIRVGLKEQLDGLMLRHGLSPQQLTLEVTESVLVKDVALAVQRLQQLRDCGFKLSLDDFGTGFSSLSYLKMFPIDELKIDRAFIAEVCRGGRDAAIARSIIALGREFDLRVVAEGVETAEQSAFLSALGCRQQQGFWFARPMPCEAFDALLLQAQAGLQAG